MFRLPRRVRFQDIDAAGILFFARAFEYFHDAYVAFLEARGLDLAAILRDRRWATSLAHAEAAFKVPLRYGDAVTIDVLRAEIEGASLRVFYEVRAEADVARVFCTGLTVHVFLDPATSGARDVPEEIRRGIALGCEGSTPGPATTEKSQ